MIHLEGREASKALQAGEYITQSAGDEIRQKNYDLISRQAVFDLCGTNRYDLPYNTGDRRGYDEGRIINMTKLKLLPSVAILNKVEHCIDCKYFRILPLHSNMKGRCIHHGGFCPNSDWYCADFEMD